MTHSNESAETTPEPAADRRPRLRYGPFVLTAVAILLTAGLLAEVVSTRSRFEKMFFEFGVKAPLPTRVFLSPLFEWFAGALFGLTIVKEFLLKSRSKRAVCDTIAICAALLLFALYVAYMFRPLIVLINKLATGS
jgi:hypothetical protein